MDLSVVLLFDCGSFSLVGGRWEFAAASCCCNELGHYLGLWRCNFQGLCSVLPLSGHGS